MSDTSTLTSTEVELSGSNLVTTSLGSISSSRRGHSALSKVYKQASNYFLTRRFQEALSTIRPLIEVPQPEPKHQEDTCEAERAPVATADRKWRIKIWSFYLTLLNTIADLGPEEGRQIFGKQAWKRIIVKGENGSIWQEVVDVGYRGNEAKVDAEVVVNLASLLLSHSTDQKKNQQYLEEYLASAGYSKSFSNGDLDQGDMLDGKSRHSDYSNGTDTPRELETRVQIIELYALHVLPRNGEWEYAREFLNLSEVLDDERREAFLQALDELQEEETGGHDQYDDALPQQDRSLTETARSQDLERIDSNITIKPDPPKIYRPCHENDYGIEGNQPAPESPALKSVPPKPVEDPAPTPVRKSSGNLQSRPPRPPPPSKSIKPYPQSTMLNRSIALIRTLHKLFSNMTFHISQNPAMLLRFMLFLMTIIAAFGRRDIRERLRRLTGSGWEKVRNTVGMGVKVSYI